MSIVYPVQHLDERTVASYKSMLDKGQDPKDMLIEVCKPKCDFFQKKLERCEIKLKELAGADPEKSCMYPLRDFVTCIDSCVNPAIQTKLVGQEKGWFS